VGFNPPFLPLSFVCEKGKMVARCGLTPHDGKMVARCGLTPHDGIGMLSIQLISCFLFEAFDVFAYVASEHPCAARGDFEHFVDHAIEEGTVVAD